MEEGWHLMKLRPLPSEVRKLLAVHGAPPHLVAHLELVHDVAWELTEQLAVRLPELKYDRKAVLIGAATHDIGKAVCRNELSERGSRHEELGQQMLLEAGFPAAHARFAWTHGGPKREPNSTIEDLLVRTADAI
jgi:putative nucleotidyltransferase with HDIG domain